MAGTAGDGGGRSSPQDGRTGRTGSLCIFCSFRLGCGATKKTAGPTWPLENTGAISDGTGLGREVYNFSLD